MSSSEDTTPGYMRLSVIQSSAVDDILMTDALLRVLVALGSYASEKNQDWLWASQETIARRIGITRQAIGQMTRELEDLGYVEIQARYREDGGRASNWVRLRFDFQLPEERRRDHHPRRKSGRGGRPVASLEPTPETPEVSPPETPEVSPPETPLSFTPLKLNGVSPESGNKKHRKEPGKRNARDTSPSENPPDEPPEPDPVAAFERDYPDVTAWARKTGRRWYATARENEPTKLAYIEAYEHVLASRAADFTRVSSRGGD